MIRRLDRILSGLLLVWAMAAILRGGYVYAHADFTRASALFAFAVVCLVMGGNEPLGGWNRT